jgi:hypothetical protein
MFLIWHLRIWGVRADGVEWVRLAGKEDEAHSGTEGSANRSSTGLDRKTVDSGQLAARYWLLDDIAHH